MSVIFDQDITTTAAAQLMGKVHNITDVVDSHIVRRRTAKETAMLVVDFSLEYCHEWDGSTEYLTALKKHIEENY